ncbi:hypothetical protein V1281_004636 [Nitrobacteraceae bacterium AZCC 2161]
MSTYVIVEASVRDKAARDRYSSQVGLAKFLPSDRGKCFLASPHSRTAWWFGFWTRQRLSPGIILPTIKLYSSFATRPLTAVLESSAHDWRRSTGTLVAITTTANSRL